MWLFNQCSNFVWIYVSLYVASLWMYTCGSGINVRVLSNRKIQLKNFSHVRGVKVEFPQNVHGLQYVERFTGLQYGTMRGTHGHMLRYMPSSSNIPAWGNIKDCTTFAPVCPQDYESFLRKLSGGYTRRFMRIKESLKDQHEDCLYLNIWAPVQGNCEGL